MKAHSTRSGGFVPTAHHLTNGPTWLSRPVRIISEVRDFQADQGVVSVVVLEVEGVGNGSKSGCPEGKYITSTFGASFWI